MLNTLFDNCNINNEDFLLKLPHYSMKKPINIINSSFTSNGNDGMIVFYDDRTGGSAGELVNQDMLTDFKNNKIKMDIFQRCYSPELTRILSIILILLLKTIPLLNLRS